MYQRARTILLSQVRLERAYDLIALIIARVADRTCRTSHCARVDAVAVRAVSEAPLARANFRSSCGAHLCTSAGRSNEG
jgi:hypothetical protein